MMKQIKKYLLVGVLMLICSITNVVADKTYSEGHFYYHSHEGYVSISGYLGREKEAEIPESIAGLPVAEIENHAFDGCDTIKVITIPPTVTEVGEVAFTGAKSLEKIISKTEGVNIVAKGNVTIENAFKESGGSGDVTDKTEKDTSTKRPSTDKINETEYIEDDKSVKGEKTTSKDNPTTDVQAEKENKAIDKEKKKKALSSKKNTDQNKLIINVVSIVLLAGAIVAIFIEMKKRHSKTIDKKYEDIDE